MTQLNKQREEQLKIFIMRCINFGMDWERYGHEPRGMSKEGLLEKLNSLFIYLLTNRDKEMREKIGKKRKTDRYIEVFDNDSHRYQIPWSKIEEWHNFVEIPEDDERSWDVPDFAERIDGQPVTDYQSYNQAIDDVLNILDGGKK